MLPNLEDFPERPELARRVLEQVRGELLMMDGPPTRLDELRYFRRRAGQQGLTLPFMYAHILEWNDEVQSLVHAVDAMNKYPDSVPTLLFHVRAVVRSVGFQCAKPTDKATIVICWAKVEARYGNVDKALAAIEWGIAALSVKPERNDTRRFLIWMELCRRMYQKQLDALKAVTEGGETVVVPDHEQEAEREPDANGSGSSNAATQSSA